MLKRFILDIKHEISKVFAILFYIFFISTTVFSAPFSNHNKINMPDTELLKFSEIILYNTKIGVSTTEIEFVLNNIETNRLFQGLPNDEAKKTFWINMYNSWYQILSTREGLKNPVIFTDKKIFIAGIKFSLDDIEHGILRKYRWKYSMGYLPKLFTNNLIKQLAVSKIDYRIHHLYYATVIPLPTNIGWWFNSI